LKMMQTRKISKILKMTRLMTSLKRTTLTWLTTSSKLATMMSMTTFRKKIDRETKKTARILMWLLKYLKKSKLMSFVSKIAILTDERCLKKRFKKWYRAAEIDTYLTNITERRSSTIVVISWFSILQMFFWIFWRFENFMTFFRIFVYDLLHYVNDMHNDHVLNDVQIDSDYT
jgi:hypothetical protein